MRSVVATAKTWLTEVRMELALGLLVLGTRLFIFSYAGSPLPYYDQWLVEFNGTLLQIFLGKSIWPVLFTPYNQHVMLTTKLTSLFGFAVIGYWDVRFLAVAAALVRAFGAALVYRLLSAETKGGIKITTWLACAAVFAGPLSGYNLLCGLQISFYFADLALIGSLFCVLRWSTAWRNGLVLFSLNLLGLFSMATVLAIPAATLATHLASRRRRSGFWTAWSATALTTGVYVAVVAYLFGTKSPGGTSGEQINFFLKLFSWPFFNETLGLILVISTLSAIAWLARTLRLHTAPFPAIVGFGVYGAVEMLLIAVVRQPTAFHLRFGEMASWVPLALVLISVNILGPMARRPLARGLLCAIVIGCSVGLVVACAPSWRYIAVARAHRTEAIAHYRDLFLSNRLRGEGDLINTMLITHNYLFFDDPILRFTPHPSTAYYFQRVPMAKLVLLSPEIVPLSPLSLASRFLRSFTNSAWCFAVLGLALALPSFLPCLNSSRTKAGESKAAV